ncbi:MAG: hypothetical protein V1918_06580 [Planctomycetota bacterium]
MNRRYSCARLFVVLLLAVPVGKGAESPARATAAKEPLPSRSSKFPFAREAVRNPNICPVCGKPWGLQDTENPHAECLKKVLPEKFPVVCPSCGLTLLVQKRLTRFHADEIDHDLCPHPPGNNRPLTEIIICPRCGLSGTEELFRKGLTPEQKEWVKNNLTPQTQASIARLLSAKLVGIRVSPQESWKAFQDMDSGTKQDQVLEESVPEVLRCTNALAFAERFEGENVAFLARLSWLTAWAYRREVAGPLSGGDIANSLRRLQSFLNKTFPLGYFAPEKRVEALVAAYPDDKTHSMLERQLMLLIMAGDYQRLGYTQWAADCLNACLRNAQDASLWRPDSNNPSGTALQRKTLIQEANARLEASGRERYFLLKAADLLQAALEENLQRNGNLYAPTETPAMIYLVGEFRRRGGEFGRAYTWLEGAMKLQSLQEQGGAEIFAAGQIELLQAALQGKPIPPNPRIAVDAPLIERLATFVRENLPAAPSPVEETLPPAASPVR